MQRLHNRNGVVMGWVQNRRSLKEPAHAKAGISLFNGHNEKARELVKQLQTR
jgi:hypothetical protein